MSLLRTYSLSLNHRDRPQFDRFLGDARCMTRVHHVRYILIALWRLLHHQLGTGDPDADALLSQLAEHLLISQSSSGFISAHSSAGTVASGAEGVGHAFIGAREHVRARAHGASDEHGLAGELVVRWDQRVMRRKRSCGSLTMH